MTAFATAKTKTSSLHHVRGKTNLSLKSERSITDESLISDARASEKQEDQILARDRGQSDKLQKRNRESRDKTDASVVGSATKKTATNSSEEQGVQRERAAADRALQDERRAVDQSRQRERRRLRLSAEALLDRERGATDADLLNERAQSDSDIERGEGGRSDAHALLSTRDEYLAIVSHDLRNPLASIAIGCEALQLSLESRKVDTEAAKELLGIVQRNIAMMERLVGDLLDVERMAAGKLEIKRSRQSLKELFGECVDLFQAVAQRKSISLLVALPPDSLFADIDSDRILQVLSNLIGNALKYTPKGGTISVAASSAGGLIEVSVVDTGSGIAPLAQAKIFNKFSQLGVSKRQGLGLGLHISKWIVEAHGGTITVSSSPGQGSRFMFTIPARLVPKNKRA